ncbi:MAG: response regulator [Pseudacidovorax sp.]|nr:response regulator [Pseudacidovorax sp.]
MKILIVDDSRAMRQVIAHMLREAGFRGNQVVEASDGQQALTVIHAEEPELIISDWNMPGLTGIQLLQAVREAEVKTPFGFVTTEVSAEMKQKAFESGASFLIGKPFSADDFRVALVDILE